MVVYLAWQLEGFDLVNVDLDGCVACRSGAMCRAVAQGLKVVCDGAIVSGLVAIQNSAVETDRLSWTVTLRAWWP